MAIRDRLTVKLRNGLPDLIIEATRQGGSVTYDEAKGQHVMYEFNEWNSAGHPVRTMAVHKDEILAIIEGEGPKPKKK